MIALTTNPDDAMIGADDNGMKIRDYPYWDEQDRGEL